MFQYPWGDFHSLNLGWFLQQFKEWVEKIEEYLNSGEAGKDNVARSMIAGQYSALFGYQKYSICRYNDKLWMCNTDLPPGGEEWNPAHWDEITVGAGLSGLRRSDEALLQAISDEREARQDADSDLQGSLNAIINTEFNTISELVTFAQNHTYETWLVSFTSNLVSALVGASTSSYAIIKGIGTNRVDFVIFMPFSGRIYEGNVSYSDNSVTITKGNLNNLDGSSFWPGTSGRFTITPNNRNIYKFEAFSNGKVVLLYFVIRSDGTNIYYKNLGNVDAIPTYDNSSKIATVTIAESNYWSISLQKTELY